MTQHYFTLARSDKGSFIDHSGEIYIVNSNKLMITGSNIFGGLSFNQIVDTKVVQEVLTSKGELSGIYENYKGVQVLGTALFVPEANWVILVEKSVEKAFLPLARIKYIFAFSGGGVLFLVFIFAFVISNKTNTIIKKLIEGTRRIANGDLEHSITIGKRKDEIKELAESFNLMMNKLRESLREKDILSREIYHRVNIKNLVNDLFLSYKVSTGKVALNINIETVSFGIDTAIPCGLIVNELVTNSLKYAFPGGKDGKIKKSLCKITDLKSEISAKADGRSPKSLAQTAGRIAPRPRPSLRLGRPGQAEMFELAVSDNGIGIPKDLDIRKTESLGLRLIINLAEKQLQGKVELDRNNGTKFQIKFKEAKYEQRI